MIADANEILYIIINVVFFSVCFLISRYISSKSSSAGNDLVGFGFLALALQLWLFFTPDVEYKIFPFNDYPYFRWWGIAGVFVVIGARYDYIKSFNPRVPVLYLFLVFLVYAFICRIKIFDKVEDFDQAGFFKGLCLQSTGYTCAPASCVTLLHEFGVKADERQMAKLCLTQTRGTENIAIARGLNMKLDRALYEVCLERKNCDSLASTPRPFITNINIYDEILHTVTVFDVKTDEVYFADSLEGKFKRVKKEEFIKVWEGYVVYITRLSR